MGLLLFPMAWSGGQLLACGPSDALMSLWHTGVSLLDEHFPAVMSTGLLVCYCLNFGVLELRTAPAPPALPGWAGAYG